MNKNEIMDSLRKYIKVFPYDNVKQMIETVEKHEPIINELTSNNLCEAVRINICCSNDYVILFSSKKQTDTCYKKVILSRVQMINLLHQCHAIETEIFADICDKSIRDIKNEFKTKDGGDEEYTIYVMFAKKIDVNRFEHLYKTEKVYDVGSIILCEESINFLKYQRLDNMCKVVNSGDISSKLVTHFKEFLKTRDFFEKEKIMIFSGLVTFIVGLTTTSDIDMLVVASESNTSYIDSFMDATKELKEKSEIDHHILLNDGVWYKNGYNKLDYQKIWLTYELPEMTGAKDIYTVLTDSRFHFYFFGIKFVSIDFTIQRLIRRSSAPSYVDLIMLSKKHNYVTRPLCIPNLRIFGGIVYILHKSMTGGIYNNIKKYAKKWHNVDISMDEITKMYPRCVVEHRNEILNSKPHLDPEISDILYYFDKAKEIVLNIHNAKKNSILNIFHKKYDTLHYWSPFDGDNTFGYDMENVIIKNDNKININKNKKYNCVILNHIQYFYNDLDIILTNLSHIIEDGGVIIVPVLDGDQVLPKMKGSRKYDIRNNQEPIFGVYEFDDKSLTKCLVYLKGIYGMRFGSVEYMIKKQQLQDKFRKHGFNLVKTYNFSEFDVEKSLTSEQKSVIDIYRVFVFKRN